MKVKNQGRQQTDKQRVATQRNYAIFQIAGCIGHLQHISSYTEIPPYELFDCDEQVKISTCLQLLQLLEKDLRTHYTKPRGQKLCQK